MVYRKNEPSYQSVELFMYGNIIIYVIKSLYANYRI